MIALVTGGSGCGKSYYAERLIARLGAGLPLRYIATMDAYDDECKARVARHRAQRAGLGFETVECLRGLDTVQVEPGAAVILECVPTLLANEMFSEAGDVDAILRGVARLAGLCGRLVVVTNDVCSDGIAYDPSTEDYKRALAGINRAIAGMADAVVEVVYSIPVSVKGDLP